MVVKLRKHISLQAMREQVSLTQFHPPQFYTKLSGKEVDVAGPQIRCFKIPRNGKLSIIALFNDPIVLHVSGENNKN